MKTILLVLIFGNIIFTQIKGQSSIPITIGNKIIFHSDTLNEDRTILIHYPDSIISPNKKYPLLLCADGEYRFISTYAIYDYHAHWQQIPEMIIVSIENISLDTRARDMTPTNSILSYTGDTVIGLGINSGHADRFLDFIEFELFPYIDSIYHPMDYRIISGHSFGGLLSGYCFVARPNLFNSYIASDPSFWYDNKIMSRLLAENANKDYNKTLYMSLSNSGGNQEESMDLFIETLQTNKNNGLKWTLDKIDRRHGDAYIDGVSRGLLYIYQDWKNWEIFK